MNQGRQTKEKNKDNVYIVIYYYLFNIKVENRRIIFFSMKISLFNRKLKINA